MAELKNLFIPSKKFGDMYKPDYANFDFDIDENLKFCWSECYSDCNDDNFYAEALMMQFGNKTYCFTEETTWIKNSDNQVEGWEEIQCNKLAYDGLIMDYFFVLHEESQFEAIEGHTYLKKIEDPIEKIKFQEFAIMLIGCTNTDIIDSSVNLKELQEFITSKTGFEFNYFQV